MHVYFYPWFLLFSTKYAKFDFLVNTNSQDLQKAWIFNFACKEHIMGVQCTCIFFPNNFWCFSHKKYMQKNRFSYKCKLAGSRNSLTLQAKSILLFFNFFPRKLMPNLVFASVKILTTWQLWLVVTLLVSNVVVNIKRQFIERTVLSQKPVMHRVHCWWWIMQFLTEYRN